MREQRRAGVALVVIVVAAVLAVGAVFALGVRYVPKYPSVAEQPAPALTGRLAYSRYDPSRGRCIWVQDFGGPAREFGCETGAVPVDKTGYFSWFGFDETGNLLVADTSGAEYGTLVTYDVATFAQVSTRPLTAADRPPDLSTRADGSRVYVEPGKRDGSWVVRVVSGEATRDVLRLRGPDDYSLWNAEWSMDGAFILVRDSVGRFLVLADAADPAPRVLMEEVDEVVWWQAKS